jgi:hypothetical protein
MRTMLELAITGAALAAFSPDILAATCSAESAARRVPLLELYTSEGCDSCPPTDRWVRTLPGRGFGMDRVVVLAYHVDYWDYIGWRDPYAQARFSERQRAANARNAARFVYTPQLMLDGKDYRRGALSDDFASRLAQLSQAPKAAIRVDLDGEPESLMAKGTWSVASGVDMRQTHGWLALYENRLGSDVRAGENRGKRLEHDFVVRDLAGPFMAGSFTHRFRLDRRWKRNDLGVAAFVQELRTGEPLQSLALPVCRP